MNRHNAAVAKDMENLGLLADPMYEYGTILPYKKNIVTGENSWAHLTSCGMLLAAC